MSIIDTTVEFLVAVVSWWKWFIFLFACALAVYCLRRYRFNYFRLDRAIGLESESFSLGDNIDGDDERAGLELWAKARIRWLMFRHGITFDEARTMDVQNTFALNDVNPDGTPRDPKAIYFV